MFIPIFLPLLLASPVFADECDFKKLDVPVSSDDQFKEHHLKVGSYTLVFGGEQSTSKSIIGTEIYEGGMTVLRKGNKCGITQTDIFGSGDIYYNSFKNFILVQGIDGSRSRTRVFDLSNCKQVSIAEYTGKAEIKSGRLVNEPSCEPLRDDGTLSSCLQGKVFRIDSKTCHFKFLKDESKKWTTKFLGVDIPENKAVKVQFPKTKHAKIVSDSEG